MKSSFYFKHDLDARGDEKMRALLMKKGATGYGTYWMIVEDLYHNKGRLTRDYEALSWDYRQPDKEIKAVVEDFGLFYDKDGKIACRRVDRGLAELEECRAQAREAGRQGGLKRSLNARLALVKQGEERKGEEGDEITAAPAAADLSKELSTAVDKSVDKMALNGEQLLELQLPFSFGDIPKGRRISDIAPACAKAILDKARGLSFDIQRALRYRIKLKVDELHPKLRTA